MSKLILIGGIVLLCAVAVLAFNTGRQYTGLTLTNEVPADRRARLAAHWRLVGPEGPGPHAGAVLLSGCDGVRDNMAYWAEALAEQGRAALIVDSHRPRNLDQLESWRLVCAGQALPGAERAGDVAVALAALRGMDSVEGGDTVILGASHGGWAAMEFVMHAQSGVTPPGLAAWPAEPAELLAQVHAMVLLYPYCGAMSHAAGVDWDRAPPTLMILGGEDSIVSTPECLSMAAELRRGGADVRTVVYEDADHGFDQREKVALSTLPFDPDLRKRAAADVRDFLKDLQR